MGNKNEWNIGVCIAKLRESRGLSQKQLSDELGKLGLKVRRETVTQWENGTRDLKTEYTIKLADFFGVSCDYILRGVSSENLRVSKETGLQNEAINKLRHLSGWCDSTPPPYQNEINDLLCSPIFETLLFNLSTYKTYVELTNHRRSAFMSLLPCTNNLDSDDLLLPLATKYCSDFKPTKSEIQLHEAAAAYMDALDKQDYYIYKLSLSVKAFAESYNTRLQPNP